MKLAFIAILALIGFAQSSADTIAVYEIPKDLSQRYEDATRKLSEALVEQSAARNAIQLHFGDSYALDKQKDKFTATTTPALIEVPYRSVEIRGNYVIVTNGLRKPYSGFNSIID